jgi:molybdenum cofactor guanylyltransferase
MKIPKSKGQLSAVLLAGGKSSRMGQDKALLAPKGIAMIRHSFNIASVVSEGVYVVTPWPERYQEILPKNCRFVREEPLFGPTETHGPLVGFLQGLDVVETTSEWVLVLACDLPYLRLDVIENWLNYLENSSEEIMAFLPKDERGWQPLCGFYRRRCTGLMEEYIKEGGRSFQGWLQKVPVQELPLADRQILFNCNTPEDLQKVSTENGLSFD